MLFIELKFLNKKIKNNAICPFTVALYLLKYDESIIKKNNLNLKHYGKKKCGNFMVSD
jgi:hypothetical protein